LDVVDKVTKKEERQDGCRSLHNFTCHHYTTQIELFKEKEKLCSSNLRGGLFFRDDFENFGGVALGSDERPAFLDFSGFADEEGAADDAHEGAAHELLFLPDAELLDSLVSRVAEQGKIESVLFLEPSKRFDGIGAHAKDGHAQLVELPLCVTKLGRFYRSTGSAGFWKEKDEDALAGEVLEGEFLAFVGFEAEGRGFGAYFEHGTFLIQMLGA